MKRQLRKMAKKVSDFFRGLAEVTGILFGIRFKDDRMNTEQAFTAAVAFIFGVPIGMLFFGTSFSAPILAAIILGCLFMVNLYMALLTISSFAEKGVGETLYGEVANG